MNGHKFPQWQREWYESVGGTPQLDQNYTVYGEVVMGLGFLLMGENTHEVTWSMKQPRPMPPGTTSAHAYAHTGQLPVLLA